MAGAPFGGVVDPAFGAVGDAFRSNFEPRGEGVRDLGASLCIVAGGQTVVDCWGGWRDLAASRQWERDTLVNAYSVLKPVAAVLALMEVERGRLSLDEPVALVWPEFAAAGKEAVTLRQVLAHRSGLPGARAVLPEDAMLRWATMCDALAESEPWWEPGTAHGYHTNTFGFLAGEPVRRASGAPYSRALRDRIAGPLALDLHVGLADAEIDRAAEVDAHTVPPRDPAEPLPALDERGLMILHAYFNPPGISGIGSVNTEAWRRAVIPSTNGHATARGVAGFYTSLLPGAPRPLLAPATLAEMTRTHSEGHDLVLDRPSHFGLGFALHMDIRPIGLTPAAFGHYGYGGSLGFADPEAGVAFAYLISRPGDRWRDARTRRIVEALAGCL